ncbi:hypothetical protein SAQ01S_27330 [Sphingomonas aquatilis NBRC 16722]|nr:hypothetical protein SAQ01S_27330 [Sphingomonas aquatilis NBRC 16722]
MRWSWRRLPSDVIAAAPTSRRLSVTPYFVIPAKAGIQTRYPCERVATLAVMDSRLRGNDGRKGALSVIPPNAGIHRGIGLTTARIADGARSMDPGVRRDDGGRRDQPPPYSAGWSPWPSRPGTGPSVGVSGPAMPTTVLPSSPGR